MPESWTEGSGFGVWAFFFVVVVLRAQATYWVARVVTQQALDHTAPPSGWRLAVHRWLSGDSAARGLELVRRWGLVAVPVSFLTVGAQTVVNAAAGVVRIPAGRYTLAMLPGCAAWAVVWTTIGLTAFYAALGAGLGSTWGIVAAVAAVLLVAALVGLLRRRRRAV